jgi:putative transposase
MFAAEIRKRRIQPHRCHPQWRWHLDEVFVGINGQTHYPWRAVGHEGEVLEVFARAASVQMESLSAIQLNG